jgi:filamentous hemagglutinin family protein
MTNKQPKYKIPSTTIAGKMYGKMCSKMCGNLPCFKLSLSAASYALAATLAMAAAANAGGVDVSKITRGNVSFSQDGNRLVVRASNGSIIEYNRFSIEAGQIMQFIQPSANSRVLNRVTGAELSRIDGSLLSNGIVYLVNPQGIRIGNGALINVGGFYAAAGAMSDNDFIRGNNTFTDLSGKVTNEGMIQAQSVALVGQYVANHGTINVDDGMIAMAAGDTVFLQNGPSPFMVTVNRSAMGADGSGAGTEAAVTNTGTINAGKGRVSMGSGDFYALGMNLSGTIIGKSIAARGGKGSVVAVNGTLDASDSTGKGGDIDVFGDRVGLFGNALVNANGATGGGSVRIGGDYLGSNAANAPQANRTFINTDARVTANATQSGNGGRVIIWSNEYTGFFGSIEANGAGTGNGVGNGGFVETSSHDNLQAFGRVDAKAALGGKGGMWLMDPANVEIVAGSAGALVAGVFDPGTSPALIGVDQINASLNSGTSVTINTGSLGDGLGGTGIIVLTGNILMNDAIGKNASLTLNALANIVLDGNITASGLGNNLSVVLNAVTGVTMNGNITTRGGSLTINNTGAFSVTQGGVSVLTIGGTTSVQTGAGAITLVGAAANDLSGAVSLRNTGAFDVSITDANGLILGISSVGRNLSVTTGSAGIPLSASLTQTGILSVPGTTSITSSAAVTDIDLSTHANNFAGTFRLLTAENIRDFSLRNINPSARAITNLSDAAFLRNLYIKFDFAAYVVPLLEMELLNNITVIAGGEITQSSLIFSNGDASFTTGAFPITLNGNNFFGGSVSFANTGTNDVSITAGFDLGLGTSNIGRDLIVVTGASGSGIPANLHQHGVLTVGRNTTVTSVAPDTDIDFSTEANDFAGTFTLLTPANVHDFALRNIHITAGAIVNLDNSPTGTTGLGDLTIIYDFAAYVVPTLTMSTLRNVAITAGGAITQDVGGIDNSVTGGTASFTTGTFAITLTDANNNFGGAVSFANTGANDVAITTANGLTLGTLNIAGGNLTAISTGAMDFGVGTVGGDLSANSNGGAITQTGALAIGGTSDMNAGANSITLTNVNNDFGGAVSLANTGAFDVAITDTNALTLGTLNITDGNLTAISTGAMNLGAGTVGGILSANSNDGAITQTGALAIVGISDINAGANSITLTNASNDFGGAVSLDNTGAFDIAITDANALTLSTSNVGQNLFVTTGAGTVTGGLDQIGVLTVAGTTTITSSALATDIDLSTHANNLSGTVTIDNAAGAASNVRDFKLYNTNAAAGAVVNLSNTGTTNLRDLTIIYDNAAYVVPTLTMSTLRNVAITAGGVITQDVGGINNSVTGGTASFSTGNFAVTLTDASNDFGGVVTLTNTGANDVAITTANVLTLGTLSIAGGNLTAISTGAMDLGVGTVGGDLSANSNGGAITQTGALAIGGTSNINAGANSITLTDASNNFSGAVSLANTGVNDVAITDANALTLGTLNIAAGNLTAISTGAMNLGAGTVGGILSANSNGGAITQSGALVIVGTSDINAGANSITLTNASNDFGGAVSLANTGVFNVAITNGSGNGLLQLATVSAGQNFTATADAITLTSTVTTSISNAGAVRLTANAGLLTINAGADINSGGEVILSGDSGIVTAGNVTTANANVSFLSATTLTGNVAITTGAGAATGDILFDGEISGSSGGENLTLTASGNIQFNNTVGGTLATTQLGTFTVDCGNNFGNTITFGALASTVRAVDVKLNTNTLLATPATVATIVASDNITFSNTTFEMGHNHKLTGLGNITIGGLAAANATSVTLGDVNAVGNLSVTSSSIALLARASGSIFTNTGGTITDPTVDYVVGGQVFFSSTPVMVGSGGRATFSNPTGNVDGSGTLDGFAKFVYSVPITAALLTGQVGSGITGQILDLSSPTSEPSNPVLNPANIIPPAMSSLASIGFLGTGDTLDSDETDDDLKTKKDSDESSAKDKKSSSDTPTTAAPVSAGSR